MVSPDWLIPMTNDRSSSTGSRYLNSEAMSISTGRRAQRSMAYLAIIAAWYEVPQATTNTLSISRRISGSMVSSSSTTRPGNSTRPARVSVIACGCSKISLSMKVSNPPFSAASKSQSTRRSSSGMLLPSRSVRMTSSGRISTTRSSSHDHHVTGVLEEGGDVRSQEVLTLAPAHDQRRAASRPDQDIGLRLPHDDEGQMPRRPGS